MASALTRAHQTLISNRDDALELVRGQGVNDTKRLLQDAARDLKVRIRAKVRKGAEEGFSVTQMRTTLAQVEDVLKNLTVGLKDTILDNGEDAAEAAADHTAQYLRQADKAFRGVGTEGLALNEARMFSEATMGAEASILRRLTADPDHPGRVGVLERYGVETVGHFERTLQRGLLAKKSWEEMEADITERSPFLQEAPGYWAARIVRTEVMGAYGRATWESIREADEQLEDMTKILAATFDERTGSDSFAIHGQIRRPEEAFQWWDGFYQHPPNRPNDREIVVAHRISWPIPPYLAWKSNADVARRWKAEGNKRALPPRPEMTTVPLRLFGRRQPKALPEGEKMD